jgi:hypothetical protein
VVLTDQEGRLDDCEVFLYTDNHTAEGAYSKGTAKSWALCYALLWRGQGIICFAPFNMSSAILETYKAGSLAWECTMNSFYVANDTVVIFDHAIFT